VKSLFKPGDQRVLKFTVQPQDVAEFSTGIVHHVYSTFALARDAEWTTRQFVLEMRDHDEEGIGTLVRVEHHSPAFVGEQVTITGTITQLHRHEIICRFEVHAASRLIASGETGQKIFKREKLEKLFLHSPSSITAPNENKEG
jgi:predicted thioesterase